MFTDNQIELLAHVWDNLSTAQKFRLLDTLVGLLLAAFGLGFALARRLGSPQLAELRARHAAGQAKSQTPATGNARPAGRAMRAASKR